MLAQLSRYYIVINNRKQSLEATLDASFQRVASLEYNNDFLTCVSWINSREKKGHGS